jgi:hypothetical protein
MVASGDCKSVIPLVPGGARCLGEALRGEGINSEP